MKRLNDDPPGWVDEETGLWMGEMTTGEVDGPTVVEELVRMAETQAWRIISPRDGRVFAVIEEDAVRVYWHEAA